MEKVKKLKVMIKIKNECLWLFNSKMKKLKVYRDSFLGNKNGTMEKLWKNK